MKILIADDDNTFRLVLGGTLKKLGHEVVATADGLQAWQAFQKEYFPVLISDWQMPQMDGMVLALTVRARPHEKYTYVILLTAHDGKANYLEGIKAGADDFLAKPFDEDYLDARLHVADRIVGLNNYTRRLEAIMSVCSYCKCVREPSNQWVGMEQYVAEHLGTAPSHTICPSCFAAKVKPDLERLGIKVDESLIR